mgnify:CR=1 FL=1
MNLIVDNLLNQYVLKNKNLTHDEWLVADIILPLGTSQITQPLVAQMNTTSLEGEIGRLVPLSTKQDNIVRMSDEQIKQNPVIAKLE